jgi:preprotein translocase subunit YajC
MPHTTSVAFIIVLILLMGGYYSFVILPRQRIFRQHNKYVRTLNIGDEVITAGGLVGTLMSMEADSGIAHVRIADGVVVKVLTSAVSRPFEQEEVSRNAQIGLEANTKPKA